MKSLIGLKLGMTRIFDDKGDEIPVTLIEAGPCEILQIKTKQKDGYDALQLGFGKIGKKNKIKKPQVQKPFKYLKEFRNLGKEDLNLKPKDTISVSVFQEGDRIKVSGISKGKGFQGTVKRHGFKGRLSVSHGTKHELRTPGSTGSSMPERVIKGKKMAGHMGVEAVSVKNLRIMKIDPENNLLVVRGAVPGRKGTPLKIEG